MPDTIASLRKSCDDLRRQLTLNVLELAREIDDLAQRIARLECEKGLSNGSQLQPLAQPLANSTHTG